MLKKIYSCDICSETKVMSELNGLRFKNLHDFRLGTATSTDGKHICHRCLDMLENEIKSIGTARR